jgi:hypothetical protein
MVHLAVGVEMHRLEGTAPSPEFLLGSIAPDAIHARPDTSEDDKRRVHLFHVRDPRPEPVRELLAQHGSGESSPMGLAEGYAAHILADRAWFSTVLDSFYKSAPTHLSDQEWWSLYYLETDRIEFDLYHQAAWRLEVWSKLLEAQPRDFASLVTAEEIREWRDRTLIWFEDLKPGPMIEPVHITGADVLNFVDRAADEIVTTFKAWR